MQHLPVPVPPVPDSIFDAGNSAFDRAHTLRQQEIRRQHRRGIPGVIAAAGLGYLLALLIPVTPANPGLLAAVLILGLPAAVAHRAYRTGPEVRRLRDDAGGELITACLLNPLTQHGWYLLHDRRTEADSNLNHVCLLPDGTAAFYIASQTFTNRRSVVRLDGDTLCCGGRVCGSTVTGIKREARYLSTALGVPVTPVIAVHGATVPGGRIRGEGITIVSAALLVPELTSVLHRTVPAAADQLTRRAATALPRHTR
ncbi:hypothetical protein [Streptomyces sp. Ac-502]|uniref:hypothetical protein n=1 Tax=Streptomyces sp. Ac-502 TaxID=3342801 RepID=UPI0038622823